MNIAFTLIYSDYIFKVQSFFLKRKKNYLNVNSFTLRRSWKNFVLMQFKKNLNNKLSVYYLAYYQLINLRSIHTDF